MANTFKNSITGSIGTSTTTVYTTPALTSTTAIGMGIANVISTNISVDVQIVDSSEAETRYLIKGALIVPGGQLVVIGGDQKVVLEAGDEIRVTSSEATSADVVVSVLEIT